ncbi:hypothetical protein [Nostoc favosum]|uniref:Uncharacterized protein n=1 Tax=Nostoc favosum CHAB5714 TaxID=2780399 RepID=A0ABS8I380_9NOSO|nr:hypothetical protein [Nostoc favosum]MCC5598616.1 hypothetical protein [Nostoc favosum CHAB5714]
MTNDSLHQLALFAPTYLPFFSRLPATVSVSAIMAGAFTLVFFMRQATNLAWIFL